MSTPTTLRFFPNCCSSSSQLKSFKPFSVHKFPSSSPVSSSGYVLGGALSRKARTFSPCTSMNMMSNPPSKASHCSRDHEGGSSVSGFMAEGLQATLNRQSKWILAALFAAIILCRHDGEGLWFAVGSVTNVIVSIKLKGVLKQERPVSNLRSDHGMPSSHAQSIFFNFTYAIISFLESLGVNEVTLLASASALAFASYLSWLRVSQQLHTISQVVVGASLGLIFSIFWNWSWNALVMEAFASFLWVQVLVRLLAAGLSMGFLVRLVRSWIRDEP